MENENKEKRAKSDETDGRNDPTDLRNNKKMPNKKEKKKIREYRKLKASEVFSQKVFQPNEIEKKYSFIQNNSDLILTNKDIELVKSIFELSNYNIT